MLISLLDFETFISIMFLRCEINNNCILQRTVLSFEKKTECNFEFDKFFENFKKSVHFQFLI